MINKIILTVCGLIFATGAFAQLSCPAQITISCPANTQFCSVTTPVPAPWRLFQAYTEPAKPKAFTMNLPLDHVAFIDNGPGYANCTYGSLSNGPGTIVDLEVNQTSARPIVSSSTKWVVSGSSTQYSTYDCPNSPDTYTPIDPAVCPFQG